MKTNSPIIRAMLLGILIMSFGFRAQPVNVHCHPAESHNHYSHEDWSEHDHDPIVHVHPLDSLPLDALVEDSGAHEHHEHDAGAEQDSAVPPQRSCGSNRQDRVPLVADTWAPAAVADQSDPDVGALGTYSDLLPCKVTSLETYGYYKRASGLSPPIHA